MTALYVIEAKGAGVKVSLSADPTMRLAQLRTGSPFRMTLAHVEPIGDDMAAVAVERAAHALLAAARLRGEWFNATVEEARAAIHAAIAAMPRPSPVLADVRLTSELVRAARALLRWEQKDLAEASGVSLPTIKRLEAKPGELGAHGPTLQALRLAIEGAGVAFIAAGAEGGAGVRLAVPVA